MATTERYDQYYGQGLAPARPKFFNEKSADEKIDLIATCVERIVRENSDLRKRMGLIEKHEHIAGVGIFIPLKDDRSGAVAYDESLFDRNPLGRAEGSHG